MTKHTHRSQEPFWRPEWGSNAQRQPIFQDTQYDHQPHPPDRPVYSVEPLEVAPGLLKKAVKEKAMHTVIHQWDEPTNRHHHIPIKHSNVETNEHAMVHGYQDEPFHRTRTDLQRERGVKHGDAEVHPTTRHPNDSHGVLTTKHQLDFERNKHTFQEAGLYNLVALHRKDITPRDLDFAADKLTYQTFGYALKTQKAITQQQYAAYRTRARVSLEKMLHVYANPPDPAIMHDEKAHLKWRALKLSAVLRALSHNPDEFDAIDLVGDHIHLVDNRHADDHVHMGGGGGAMTVSSNFM